MLLVVRVQRFIGRQDIDDDCDGLQQWTIGHLINETIDEMSKEKKYMVRFASREVEEFYARQVHDT